MPEDFQMSRTGTHGTYSVNDTHQSYPSNISSLEHHLWQGKAAEEDFWRASASGWHCKTSSMEGAAVQGSGGGTAAQTLRSQSAAHPVGWVWASWGRCSLAGGAGKMLAGRETGTGAGKEASPRAGGTAVVWGQPSQQECECTHIHTGHNPFMSMGNLPKGRSSSSASPALLLECSVHS